MFASPSKQSSPPPPKKAQARGGNEILYKYKMMRRSISTSAKESEVDMKGITRINESIIQRCFLYSFTNNKDIIAFPAIKELQNSSRRPRLQQLSTFVE